MENTKQITSTILMIRPKHFGSNPETAINNTFQARELEHEVNEIHNKALYEFDHMVSQLRNAGIHVVVIDDTDVPEKPDAIFPNNWITTHEDGSLITYPMFSEIRRNERREDIIAQLEDDFEVINRYSFDQYEEKDQFLEGTGSLVLDRVNRIAYACLSPRTHVGLLDKFGVLKGYRIEHFTAKSGGTDIYHTNVMMAMGHDFVVICLEAIPDAADRSRLLEIFLETNKDIIEITVAQMNSFAGNMLELENQQGDAYVVMSQQAFQSLTDKQISQIMNHAQIISCPINMVEKYGGGSARCMIAEIFLPFSEKM